MSLKKTAIFDIHNFYYLEVILYHSYGKSKF